jgi:hypothetical protein
VPHEGIADGDVTEFRDRDRDYLEWLAEHPLGYVLNIGRSGRGAAVLHRASCWTITTRAPFTGPYMKVCAMSGDDLDRWTLQRTGRISRRCQTCQPSASELASAAAPAAEPAGSAASGVVVHEEPSAPPWQAEGPRPGTAEVWLRARQYIPFERLSQDQLDARTDLRRRVRSLEASSGEILDASYAGPKPANADVENLVLYNIGGGCFQPGTRYGVRFEMALGSRRDPSSGIFGCSYRYRLISPDSELAYWRPVRTLARFTSADLGHLLKDGRTAHVWLAIHRAEVVVDEPRIAVGAPFALFLTLRYPIGRQVSASPELVKAMMDGTIAAFQAHGDGTTLSTVAERIAATTGQAPAVITPLLADDRRAVLGIVERLVFLRADSVQWNPGDHVCMAGQLAIEPTDATTWTLAGKMYELEPLQAPSTHGPTALLP